MSESGAAKLCRIGHTTSTNRITVGTNTVHRLQKQPERLLLHLSPSSSWSVAAAASPRPPSRPLFTPPLPSPPPAGVVSSLERLRAVVTGPPDATTESQLPGHTQHPRDIGRLHLHLHPVLSHIGADLGAPGPRPSSWRRRLQAASCAPQAALPELSMVLARSGGSRTGLRVAAPAFTLDLAPPAPLPVLKSP